MGAVVLYHADFGARSSGTSALMRPQHQKKICFVGPGRDPDEYVVEQGHLGALSSNSAGITKLGASWTKAARRFGVSLTMDYPIVD